MPWASCGETVSNSMQSETNETPYLRRLEA